MDLQQDFLLPGEKEDADVLTEKVRVLCWVLTHSGNHESKAQHVRATWGKRCNFLIFMSNANDTRLGAINLNVLDGRKFLWGKTRMAFEYVYKHHFEQFDWFFKADDDTYAIMENLRYMLSAYDPTYPIYFGAKFRGFMSGGGGYVLSKQALKQFVESALHNDSLCQGDPTGVDEDVKIGKCLANVGVMEGDSRDEYGRGRFFPLSPMTHIMNKLPHWYIHLTHYKPHKGLDCCSDTAITFHYISPEKMYEMDYLLYGLRPYGIHKDHPYPAPLPPDVNSIPQEMLKLEKNQKVFQKRKRKRVNGRTEYIYQ
ncbi:glycoprotein-N-acetylgalactosamine 3-beta-galactosyltransferase activity protein [Halocaridina rubra]|uniref:Glycoprotein-N-acetylgalactosamine 3-beta-galactosyltransferase 1 n=1 Tax=Halocaridina rubra TaxID=373956 RepID=A0AAN8XA20_HALRR